MLHATFYRNWTHTPENQHSGISGIPELLRNIRNSGVPVHLSPSNEQPSSQTQLMASGFKFFPWRAAEPMCMKSSVQNPVRVLVHGTTEQINIKSKQKGLVMPNFVKKTNFRLESQRPIGLHEQPAIVMTPSCFLMSSFLGGIVIFLKNFLNQSLQTTA